MAAPEIAGLPPFLILTKGQTVRFTALDAVTGDLVANVTITDMTLGVDREDAPDTAPAPAPAKVGFLPT